MRRDEGGCFVELLAREQMRKAGAASGTATVASSDGSGVPNVCGNIVERDTLAGFVEVS